MHFARLGRHGAGGKREYFLEYLMEEEEKNYKKNLRLRTFAVVVLLHFARIDTLLYCIVSSRRAVPPPFGWGEIDTGRKDPCEG